MDCTPRTPAPLSSTPHTCPPLLHPAHLPTSPPSLLTCRPFLDPEYTSSSSAYSRSAAIGSRWVEEVRTWEEGRKRGEQMSEEEEGE